MQSSPNKKKATAQEHATQKAGGRRNEGGEQKVPPSDKEASQGRFPGETPLTGEDRPADRPGGKKDGQVAKRGQ